MIIHDDKCILGLKMSSRELSRLGQALAWAGVQIEYANAGNYISLLSIGWKTLGYSRNRRHEYRFLLVKGG